MLLMSRGNKPIDGEDHTLMNTECIEDAQHAIVIWLRLRKRANQSALPLATLVVLSSS
jgi:hypothetical protein